jgi:NAD(P)-dependent dehydrogenase (short-subunit alcohol dehydrogenase family)
LPLVQRAALVTGGSSGIGRAVAAALIDEGYGVTISARGVERLRDTAAQIGAQPVAADVSDEEHVHALVLAHGERFGRLDVLVNNAGVEVHGALQDMAPEEVELQLDVNLRGPALMLREALPLLREAGAEHGKALVVNVASMAGKSGQAGLAAYSASKAGVIGLSQAVQRELEVDGVQVTAICPGFVDTPMVHSWAPIPPGEMLRPEDVGQAVRFLLSTSPVCRVPEIVLSRASTVPPA